MLKLKKLQILGFKSFCDRTELKFEGDGIAAIVGPNGCGKSNIADAISWVLGEQSAKTLRGSRMEDVIFAGTRDRKPTGMAEVSLTLIDPEVFEGPLADLSTEVEVRDEMPADDWDEAAQRLQAAEETERVSQELQPQKPEPEENPDPAELDGPIPLDVVLRVRRRRLKRVTTRAGQIVVTRRLFRSGESEYLMNGKLCRLRDIQDLFLGTGLGPESYAIIEQGRIGQILSSRPHDRRAIIEEAAGITRFKTKKRLAEARLEQAQQNLARLSDIFEEVTRQMNSLKRQAAKAERYVRLRDEMRGKLRLVLASKLDHFATESAALEAEQQRIAGEIQALGETVGRLEAEQGDLTRRGYSLDDEIARNRERGNTLALESDRAAGLKRHNQERCAELVTRSAAAESELEQTYAQLAALEKERAANRAVLDSAEADVAAAQQEAAVCRQEVAQAAAALDALERQQELRRQQIFEALGTATTLRNQLAQVEGNMAALVREAQRLAREIEAARSQRESFHGQRGQMALEFESATSRREQLRARTAELGRDLEARRRQESDTRQELDALRATYAATLGKKGSLEALIAEHGYSTESVKRLMQNGNSREFQPVGVLADFLEVDDAYERVVEEFLRDELNYIVVKSWDAADEGLRLLRTGVDGRATFLVHPDDSQAKFSFAVDEAARPAPPRDSIVPLTRCIRVLNGFGKSLEVILPKLRDGFIAPGPAVARELALENPDAFFLAQSGECFHNVTVTGGKQQAGGPLSLKRELRKVEQQAQEMAEKLSSGETQVAALGREIAEMTSLLQRVEAEQREVERQAMTSGTTLEQLDRELARLDQRLALHQQEATRVQDERSQQESEAADHRKELAALEEVGGSLERDIHSSQKQFEHLKTTRETAARTASEMAVRLAALDERRIAAAAALGRIESLAAEVAARVETLRPQIAAAADEKQQREAENLDLAARLAGWAEERSRVEALEVELRASAEQARTRIAAIEQELRSARLALDSARDRRGEVAASAAKLQSDTEHMAETCLTELGVAAAQLREDASLVRVSGAELAAEDARYHELRARLDAMGPVNMMALEEYNEIAARHSFLESQRKDLMESIQNTQNTIREIDVISRQLFQEAFEKINENFQMTFRKLFGGGQGFMKLTDEENTAESGIDVVASPPGKRLQNVLLLSGGEKALTALALLVGIFQYQPSPFCILDEVDAPLDEANIGRFTDLVRELSAQTQFVLITHSKKTMDIAPMMYGVTMQEPGVSKLVAVKFGESARQARSA